MKQKNTTKAKKSTSLSEVSIDIILNIIKVSVLSLSQLTLLGPSSDESPCASSCSSVMSCSAAPSTSAADHRLETQEYLSCSTSTRVLGKSSDDDEPTQQLVSSSYFIDPAADQEVYIWKPRRVVEEDVNDRAGDYISKVRKGFNKGN
ncbi:hypothetical protein ACLOJK_004129 [Asimina triloba]